MLVACTLAAGGIGTAEMVLTLSPSGSDLVLSGAGSLNLSALSKTGTSINYAEIDPQTPIAVAGPDSFTSSDRYTGGITGPLSLGPGWESSADEGTGDIVGILLLAEFTLAVPQNYVSGAPLASSSTFQNYSIADLGVTPGVYTWSWGIGESADSLTLEILSGQEGNGSSDISAGLEAVRAAYHLPGISAMAVKGGKIVAQGATGVRRQGHTMPLSVDDRINLGSCSKWMTAVVAARLVDRNLIDWTTRVRDLFPNFLDFHPTFHNTKLEEFLAHRSGVQDSVVFLSRHWADLQEQDGTVTELRRWVSEKVLTDAPEATPGDFHYANQGYAVVASMLELASGQTFDELIQQEIFKPLRMKSAGLGIVYGNSLPPSAPVGHDLANGSANPVPRQVPNLVTYRSQRAAYDGSGFVACTLADWAKFLHVMMVGQHSDFLSAGTWERMQEPYVGTEGYGFGINLSARSWASPGPALDHSGEFWGQSTLLWAAPAHDFITIAFTNCDTANDDALWALDDAIGEMIGDHAAETPEGPWLEVPAVLATDLQEGMFSFEFSTLPGVAYRVDTAPGLTGWEPASALNGAISSSLKSEWSAAVSGNKGFFRAAPVRPSSETISPGTW